MSEFEYVTVLISFVVAFGVSEILTDWGRQYRSRRRVEPFPLQIAASTLLLVTLLISVWGYWGYRDVDWTFWQFILALLPLFVLVGATHVIASPYADSHDDSVDTRSHYFSNVPALCWLLALWVVLGTLVEVMLVDTTLHVGQFARAAAIVLLVAIGRTQQSRLHWIGFGLLALMQLLFVQVVAPELG